MVVSSLRLYPISNLFEPVPQCDHRFWLVWNRKAANEILEKKRGLCDNRAFIGGNNTVPYRTLACLPLIVDRFHNLWNGFHNCISHLIGQKFSRRLKCLLAVARGTIFAGEAGRYGQAKPGRYLPFARAQAHKTGSVPGILREKNHNKFLRNSFFLEIVIEGHFFRQQRLYNHQKPPHGLGQSMLYVYSFKMGLWVWCPFLGRYVMKFFLALVPLKRSVNNFNPKI